MKVFILLSLFMFSFSSWAHFEIGTYVGKQFHSEDPCEITFVKKDFRFGIRNPLNEEVTVRVQGEEFLLTHPLKISETGPRRLDYDHVLIGHKGTTTGARALKVEMSHETGPTKYTLMTDSWGRVPISSFATCSELQYRGE